MATKVGHTALQQVGEDGARQRGALLRVGARAQFVQDAPASRCPLCFEDADDVGDVTAEGAQRLLDGLLVADVGIDRRESSDSSEPLWAGMCSPHCAITASSPTVLSETVLPPVFGPVMTSAKVPGLGSMSMGTTVADRAADAAPRTGE